ncbi:DUF6199 family natural product biosynthesis protein [Botrimarina mediterranea]|uniref:DUF6199 domain-containing protein n=1 Tax=Botrimarina mediterranea TaxID=2528022 RepID=A0A518K672_9BACT|nr:DUF6199 family natural product biosynthesis protein [Botrimarina mediterranea]QDV73277.1 hypothetical protein Spa11_14730 [Botrimarina mediterranea]QDV77794.1 hypothetical protein K2D_13990 [Planctomycetes bacterium K2D]
MIELLVLLALILLGFGFAMMLFPKIAWRSAEGWKFANAEPSQAVLSMYRVFGFLCASGGCVLLWYASVQG